VHTTEGDVIVSNAGKTDALTTCLALGGARNDVAIGVSQSLHGFGLGRRHP
jgi:hypothetical protein